MRWVSPLIALSLVITFLILLVRPKPDDPVAQIYEGATFDFSTIKNMKTTGGESNFSDLPNDRPSIINFWASWCTECEKETQDFNKIYDQNVNLVSINVFDTKENAMKAKQNWGMNFDFIEDNKAEVAINMGVSSLPVTYIISPAGLITKRFWGPVTERQVIEALKN
jgi:thiol-disulfide isomerase/thioredoxin